MYGYHNSIRDIQWQLNENEMYENITESPTVCIVSIPNLLLLGYVIPFQSKDLEARLS